MNPDDIQDPFAVVPEGHYVIRCTKAELKKTKETNLDMVVLQHQIEDGDAEDISFHIGKNLFDYNVIEGDEFSGRAGRWRMKEYCIAAGIDMSDYDPEELINLQFDVDVTVDPPQPEKGYPDESNSIKRVYTDVA